MDIFREYATDDKKENEGIWKDIGDASFLVARAGNRAYAALLTSRVEESQRVLDSKTDAGKALSEAIMLEVSAKTVLLGWKGAVKFKGADLPYSFENAKTLLSIKDFRKLVGQWSDDFNAYRVEDEEAARKN